MFQTLLAHPLVPVIVGVILNALWTLYNLRLNARLSRIETRLAERFEEFTKYTEDHFPDTSYCQRTHEAVQHEFQEISRRLDRQFGEVDRRLKSLGG